MINERKYIIPPNLAFAGFAALTLLSVLGASFLELPLLAGLPFLVLAGLFLLINFKAVYLALLFFIPLSLETDVGGGFATDMPTEPLMVLLMLVGGLYAVANPKKVNRNYLQHPLILLLIAHVCWIGLCVFYSQMYFVSLKFFFAKLWYVVVFVLLTAHFIKNARDFKAVFWCIFLPLLFVVIRAIIIHYSYGFSFEDVYMTMTPYFRNHVNYAVMLVVFLPYVFYARRWTGKGSLSRLFIDIGIVAFFIGIILAYTRAAYLSLLIMPVAAWVLREKLTAFITTVTFLSLLAWGAYSMNSNRWLDYAPDFESTIYHTDFSDHLTATFEGKDISSMERVYRWVAALRMSTDHLFVGFGPGNFYNFYGYYTVDSFKTYVSDNPEKSGVHNYFLMILVEQGVLGLLIFLSLCVLIFIRGENLLRRLKDNKDAYQFVMTLLVSTIVVIANITLADLIEVDKIGSLFFINIAMLVHYDLKY